MDSSAEFFYLPIFANIYDFRVSFGVPLLFKKSLRVSPVEFLFIIYLNLTKGKAFDARQSRN
jgi:hypothetical protein